MSKYGEPRVPIRPLVAMVKLAVSGEPSHAPWKWFEVGNFEERQSYLPE